MRPAVAPDVSVTHSDARRLQVGSHELIFWASTPVTIGIRPALVSIGCLVHLASGSRAVEQQRIEYAGIFGQEAADALIDQEYYCSFEAAILGADAPRRADRPHH
jgi:hypothetical protein